MLTLAYPWLLVLLPLPLLVWWLVPARRETRQGLVVPFLARLAEQSGQRPLKGAVILQGGWWRWLAVCFCWICAVFALARPQIIEPPVTKEIPVRDLVLAVDLSGSMATKDFKNVSGQTVDRLTAVKEVLDAFLAKRQGDRVALIFFGSAPFVQVPFTEDLKVCRQLMDEAQVSMAGPQTAFGDAIGLAINLFDRSEAKERVLIALTDGNDTASQVPPLKAAQIAKDKGITIHTVAVGDPRAVGEDALDENTLKQVASTTGGLYAHAADTRQLDEIYSHLDKLETRKAQTISHRPRHDIYWWPLAAALMVSMLLHIGQLLRPKTSRTVKTESPGRVLASFAPFSLAALWPLSFHFIRPAWLLALAPAALLWWLLRRRNDAKQLWRGIVAPHLLTHLLGGEEKNSHLGPLEFIGLGWLLTVVAIAGPTWKQEPAPFADDVAAIAIVVKVSPSMTTEDVQPSRLARATDKIHDLLKERGAAKTSLIAYAGSAHVVMPPTKDSGIIDTFARALDPKIMPVVGDVAAEALKLADQTLVEAGGGSILWITDSIAAEQKASLSSWRKSSSTAVRLLPPLFPGPELDAVITGARTVNASVVRLAADDTDIRELASASKFASANGGDTNRRWAESGYWLTPVIAALLLLFFRKGMDGSKGYDTMTFNQSNRRRQTRAGKQPSLPLRSSVPWVVGLLFLLVLAVGTVRNPHFWLTADQRGDRLFAEKKYAEAAKTYADPWHIGMAQYRDGQFEAAAKTFARVPGADGAFDQGNAWLMGGKYDEAIERYDRALGFRPGWKEAEDNKALAMARKEMLAESSKHRAEESANAYKPQEIKFDLKGENKEGKPTEMNGEKMSDAELRALWLRRVQTTPGDFLRAKFAYQAASAEQPSGTGGTP